MADELEAAEVRVLSIIFSEVIGYGSALPARVSWTWRKGDQFLEKEALEIPFTVPRSTQDSAEWVKMVLAEILLEL